MWYEARVFRPRVSGRLHPGAVITFGTSDRKVGGGGAKGGRGGRDAAPTPAPKKLVCTLCAGSAECAVFSAIRALLRLETLLLSRCGFALDAGGLAFKSPRPDQNPFISGTYTWGTVQIARLRPS